LESFLKWAVDVRLLCNGHGLHVPKPIREARRGPRWLDRREQHWFMRAVEYEGTCEHNSQCSVGKISVTSPRAK
jgi:hypothetical protein